MTKEKFIPTLEMAVKWNDSDEKFIYILDELLEMSYTDNERFVDRAVETLETAFEGLLLDAGIEVRW